MSRRVNSSDIDLLRAGVKLPLASPVMKRALVLLDSGLTVGKAAKVLKVPAKLLFLQLKMHELIGGKGSKGGMMRRKKNYAYPAYTFTIDYPLFPKEFAELMELIGEKLPDKVPEISSVNIVRVKSKGLGDSGRGLIKMRLKDVPPRRLLAALDKTVDYLIALGELEPWYMENVAFDAY